MNFGKDLKALLVVLGMTQHQLALKTGLTPSAISQFISESRTPEINSLLKICQALDVRPSYFLEPRPTVVIPVEIANRKNLSSEDKLGIAKFCEYLQYVPYRGYDNAKT